MLTEIRDILNHIAFTSESIYGSGGIPGYQHGTNYVPHTGLYTLHEGEKVIPAGRDYPELSINININESKTPRETGNAVTGALDNYFLRGRGREIIRRVSSGKI
jgi:hypothetical protein